MTQIKMPETLKHPNVEIAVKNFGPIAEAKIDLRPRNLAVVLIELKSGTFKTSTVAGQLQSGADFVTELFGKLPKEVEAALSTLEVTCVPTLFHGKRIDRFELRELERAKVRFLNRNAAIKRRKCGEPRNLALVLKG